MFNRLFVVVPLAILVTAALFFLMRELIGQKAALPDETPTEEFSITREIRDPPPERDPIGPQPPEAEPPQPEPFKERPVVEPSGDGISTGRPPTLDFKPPKRVPYPDGPATPMARFANDYPSCGRGNGEAVVEFYVEADGRIRDVTVVRSTSSCFANAAKRAALKWHYRPRVENGEAVRSRRQRVALQYVMPG